MKFDTITDLGNLQKDNLSVKAQISCLCTDYPSVKGMFEAVKIPIITKLFLFAINKVARSIYLQALNGIK